MGILTTWTQYERRNEILDVWKFVEKNERSTCDKEPWLLLLVADKSGGVFFWYIPKSSKTYCCQMLKLNVSIWITRKEKWWRIMHIPDESEKDWEPSLAVSTSTKCTGSEVVTCLWSPSILSPAYQPLHKILCWEWIDLN